MFKKKINDGRTDKSIFWLAREAGAVNLNFKLEVKYFKVEMKI